MTSKELMIGDWVYNKHFNGEIEPIQIHNIYGTEVNCKTERNCFDVDEIVSGTYMSDLQPIPLAAEILEKNGFYYENNVGHVLEYYNYEIIYNIWEHELRILENREQILKIKTFDEMCVHELQHALRLCGIDKEIEI